MAARPVLRRILTTAVSGGLVVTALAAPPALAQRARQADDCVTIGKPRPSAAYTYERTDARGAVTEYTRTGTSSPRPAAGSGRCAAAR